jgi:cyclohexadieny/prephenate dehydrogenase
MAVLGLGLLGGSVAAAARERKLAREVVGAGRRRAPLERALAAGLVDRISTPAEAVLGADFVVLATPVGAMGRVVAEVAPGLAEGALLTDVGSVKTPVLDMLSGMLPEHVEFVGSHPMAGSHLRGPDHAREDLFDGATCVVTPRAGQDPRPVERVEAFWRAVGARVKRRTASEHDSEVAWVSHLPHLVAFAFADALHGAPTRVGEVAGGGFRDFTRIAQSDAELWGEILGLNGKALAGPLNHFSESLAKLAQLLEEGDLESLERLLNQARSRLAEVASHAARVAGNVPEAAQPKGSGKSASEVTDAD